MAAIKKNPDNFEFKTSTGRVFKYEKLKRSERMELVLACGTEGSGNMIYFANVMMASGIREIDGFPNPLPRNKMEINRMLDLLDEDFDEFMVEWSSRQPTGEELVTEIKN